MSFQNAIILGVNVNNDAYIRSNSAPRGSKEFVVSPSSLKRFAAGPEEWIVEGQLLAELRKELDGATDRKARELLRRDIGELEGDSKAKDWGSMIDTRLLTPDTFAARYAVRPDMIEATVLECPSCGSVTDSPRCRKCKTDREEKRVQVPWSGRSEACAEWTDEQESAGKVIITIQELKDCDRAVARLLDKPLIRKAVECSDHQVHVLGEWLDKATGIVVPVQCLIDFVPRPNTEWVPDVELQWPKVIGDLKVCRSADIVAFSRQVYQFGWHIQAAFDLALYCAATGEDRTDWLFIGQKNFGVYQPFKRLLAQDFLDLGTAEYRRMLGNYAWCVKNGRWPDADDTDESLFGCGRAAPEPFMAGATAFAPRYNYEDTEDDTSNADKHDDGDIVP